MSFVPDSQESVGRFVPDSAETKSLVQAYQEWLPTRENIQQEPQKDSPSVGEHILGAGETALSVATGIPARMIGNVKGMLQGGVGEKGVQQAQQIADEFAGKYTYNPKTEAGKEQAEFLGKTLGALPPVAPGISPSAGSIVRQAGTKMGANEIAYASRLAAGQSMKGVHPQVVENTLRNLDTLAAQNRARVASLELPVIEGVEGAKSMGWAIPPSSRKAGLIATTAESLSGSPRLEKLALSKNQKIADELGHLDLRLPPDAPLTRESIDTVRTAAHAPYERLKSVPFIGNDAQYFRDMREVVKGYDTAAESYSHRTKNPVQDKYDGLTKSMDGKTALFKVKTASAVEEIKLLRKESAKAYADKDSALGDAYRKMAKAIDDAMDRSLQKQAKSNPKMRELVDDYHDARVIIAKSYLADKALTGAGHIDSRVYARALKNKVPLTGAAKQIAVFARDFDRVAPNGHEVGSTGATWHDALFGALMRGSGGLAADIALVGARPIMRHALLSKPAQRLMRQNGKPNKAVQSVRNAFSNPDIQQASSVGGIENQEQQ